MINGEKRQEKGSSFSKKVGLGVFQPIGVNPESNELIEKWGFKVWENEDDEEDNDGPVYVKTLEKYEVKNFQTGNILAEEEDVKQVELTYYLREVVTEKDQKPLLRKKTFYIIDMDAFSKNNPDSFLWINTQGKTFYGETKEDLPQWFTKYPVRKAKIGEKEFYEFLRASYDLKWNEGNTCLLQIKDLFKGKFKEAQEDLEASGGPVILPVVVGIRKNKEGNEVEVEKLYSAFAPARPSFVKTLSVKTEGFTPAEIASWRKEDELNRKRKKEDRKFITDFEKMLIDFTSPQYGYKGFSFLGPLKDFNRNDFAATATKGAVLQGSYDDGPGY